MLSAQQLKDLMTSVYKRKRSYYATYLSEKSVAMIEVEKYLQSIIDAGDVLPVDAAFHITNIMHAELMQNQQDCLSKVAVGITTSSVLSFLWLLYSAKSGNSVILELAHYELYVPLILYYGDLFRSNYQGTQAPISLRDLSVFSAWAAMMEALELAVRSTLHESKLLIEEKKYCDNPVISSEVVEWLYQLKNYFNITPSSKTFESAQVLFSIKEASLRMMLANDVSLTQEIFVEIENNPENFSFKNKGKTIRTVAARKNAAGITTFHSNVISAKELLQAAKAAYYKGLSYKETYLTKMPEAMAQMENYLQALINADQAFPENAAFEITKIMQVALVGCLIKQCTEKKEKISERFLMGVAASVYVIYLTYSFLKDKPLEKQLAAGPRIIGILLFANFLNYIFDRSSWLFLHDFGVFRAWEVIMQKLDIAFIQGLDSVNHTNPFKALSDFMITNPCPDEEITTTYSAIGGKNKPQAKELVEWLSMLSINHNLYPSALSFQSSEQLNAVVSASEQLATIEGFLTLERFSFIEKHANIYSAPALKFMRSTDVLTPASFEQLFSEKQMILMSKAITEHLWDKLPGHLEIPPVWHRIVECCDYEDAEQRLISYADKLLSGNPLDRANIVVNGPQSTHAPSVHRTISKSALALLMRYGQYVSYDDSESQNFLSKLFRTEKITAAKIFQQIEHWVKSLPDTEAKNQSAKLGFAKLKTPDFFYKDKGSNITTLQLLPLVWIAIHDSRQRMGNVEDALIRLRDSFYEIEREYNLAIAGTEKGDVNPLKSLNTCISGAFHKLLEALWGTHPDVTLEYIVPEGATVKLIALIRQAAELVLLPLSEPNSIEELFIFTCLALQIKENGVDAVVKDAANRCKNAAGNSIAKQVFEEYASIYENNPNHPLLLGLFEAGNSISLDFSQFQQSIQASEGYGRYRSQLIQNSGWFSTRVVQASMTTHAPYFALRPDTVSVTEYAHTFYRYREKSAKQSMSDAVENKGLDQEYQR